MKVVLAAIGSRGDVLPFAHLAGRFASAGHDVTLVTHDSYPVPLDSSVRLTTVPSDPRTLMSGPAARAMRRGDPWALNRTRQIFADFIHSAQTPTREALPGADVLIASTFAIAAVDEALRHRVPVIRAHMWPEYAELAGPMPLLPYDWLVPGPLRRLTRASLRRVESYLGGVQGWWQRARLHLVARHPVGLTTATAGSLYAFSPHVVDDEPANGVLTGWWVGDSAPTPLSDNVAAALADGDDWVYAGFGSMTQGDPRPILQSLARACAALGLRAVTQIGNLRGSPHPNLLCIGEEPHAEIFPRVRAVIHHGGAGTTGTVARAGVPSVVVPHFADQFYWGRRLHALGVAARPVPRTVASTALLTRRLEQATATPMRQRAADLADRVRDEDGCGLAVRRVEQWVTGPERR